MQFLVRMEKKLLFFSAWCLDASKLEDGRGLVWYKFLTVICNGYNTMSMDQYQGGNELAWMQIWIIL